MKVAVLKERYPGENRVALLPDNVEKLTAAGYDLLVERGAGVAAAILDSAYESAGAQLVDRTEITSADILLQVRSLGANPINGDEDLELMHPGQIVIGMCDPLGNAHAVARLAKQGISQVALEMIPRITRAQSMDVLSSMATIAGYRAVLHGAFALPRMFPLNMTAAGTLKAAKVFIIGAGVAGLQAAATAKRLGAVVSAYDVRPDCREQVESIGARFVEVELETEDAEDEGGYAKQQSEDFLVKQRALMAELAAESDVVITTAAIPGRQSPLLLTADAVAGMKPGSVIVDLAAERGGNCELSQPDETVVVHDITILGPTNLPAEIPFHASQMFGNNITKFLLHIAAEDGGDVQLDVEDEIIKGCLVCCDGEVIHERIVTILEVDVSMDSISEETAEEVNVESTAETEEPTGASEEVAENEGDEVQINDDRTAMEPEPHLTDEALDEDDDKESDLYGVEGTDHSVDTERSTEDQDCETGEDQGEDGEDLMMDSHLPDLADPYEDSEADEFDLSENGAYEDRDDDERMDDINQFQDETDDE
ncbi:MAG: Re/Si-specific NAD(P)(+) transhydrogenase subunit alpha [Planctomycetota bacterium]|nr:Re/Si-specific NAD(P)(+) transhydrogenase subunit alpha [Planctomycetota bacterium]